MLNHERRFFASIIDIGIPVIITFFIIAFFSVSFYIIDIIAIIVYFFVSFIYTFLSILITKDKTIGLFLMSLKLLSRDWEKPNLKAILIRSIANAVPVLYIVNIFYMLLNKTEETFFDELSDSFVISTVDNFEVD